MLWAFENIPFLQQLHRFGIYLGAEEDWQLFPMTKNAAKYRQKRRKQIEAYMRKTSPAKYHDILIPDFEVGCKVRDFSTSCTDPGVLTGLSIAPDLRLRLPCRSTQSQSPPHRRKDPRNRPRRRQNLRRYHPRRRHRPRDWLRYNSFPAWAYRPRSKRHDS
jgi:hypothetical protein